MLKKKLQIHESNTTVGFNLEVDKQKNLKTEFDEDNHLSHSNQRAVAAQFTETC